MGEARRWNIHCIVFHQQRGHDWAGLSVSGGPVNSIVDTSSDGGDIGLLGAQWIHRFFGGTHGAVSVWSGITVDGSGGVIGRGLIGDDIEQAAFAV
jgi:hypothetical protein